MITSNAPSLSWSETASQPSAVTSAVHPCLGSCSSECGGMPAAVESNGATPCHPSGLQLPHRPAWLGEQQHDHLKAQDVPL